MSRLGECIEIEKRLVVSWGVRLEEEEQMGSDC